MASHVEQLPAETAAQPDANRARLRRGRSVALAIALCLFAVTFYVLTIVKMGPALFERGL
ncbi:MAG: hypothetical protein KIS86_11850 [Devosia sp.]|nr:hypothetical protein [Devosia sp.]